jgi:geranylgeranyl diphosphate synthase type I
VLLAHAYTGSEPEQRRLLDRLVGDPKLDAAQVAELRDVIESTGALQAVEDSITSLHRQAVAALDRAAVSELARVSMRELAARSVRRSS